MVEYIGRPGWTSLSFQVSLLTEPGWWALGAQRKAAPVDPDDPEGWL
jgi:hypothetical protein